MTVEVQPTEDAFVYCYYQDAGGQVARVFPNRFQPDAFVRARTLVQVPPASGQSFRIQFEHPGGEEAVVCLAAADELGSKLPETLRALDLAPLPVGGVEDVVAAFRAVGGGRPINEARMAIAVTN